MIYLFFKDNNILIDCFIFVLKILNRSTIILNSKNVTPKNCHLNSMHSKHICSFETIVSSIKKKIGKMQILFMNDEIE